jgi:hypothetical protein
MSSNVQQWTCRVCSFDNSDIQNAACGVCNSPNHHLVWGCSACSFHNSDQNLEACDMCNSPRHPAVLPPADAAVDERAIPLHDLRSTMAEAFAGFLAASQQRNSEILASFGFDPSKYKVNSGTGFGFNGIIEPVEPEEFDVHSHIRQAREAKAADRCDASRQLSAAMTPVSLPLFAVLEQLHRARMYLRLCNAEGESLTSVLLPPPEHRLRLRRSLPHYTTMVNLRDQDDQGDDCDLHFGRVPDVILGRRQHLRATCDAFAGKLLLLLTQGNRSDTHLLHRSIDSILRRIAIGRVSVMLQELEARAQFHRSKGQCVAAAKILKHAIALGSLPSRAHLADMLLDGREGLREDRKLAFELVDRGADLGCHHCQGVLSKCYSLTKGRFGHFFPSKCHIEAHNRDLYARQSAAKGSR